MYYSHLATTKNCNYQLIDRNVSKLLVNHENIGYSTLIYQKTDKSVWGLGADNVFKVFDQNLGSGYQMPFCALGECKPEIILENKGINTVLVNQKIDFYANVYPTNSEFDVIKGSTASPCSP